VEAARAVTARLGAWLRAGWARLFPLKPTACPHCGLAFDAQRWPRHNERRHYHGRYTITPVYICPHCDTPLPVPT
jgi:hypothetical protein